MDISHEKRTLEDDFISFHEYLYGEGPADEKKKLYNRICKEVIEK